MSRKRKPPESKSGAPEWMTTYGDLVTLLLTFFVLLFSFSTVDAQKWQALVSSFTGNIGILEGGETIFDLPGVGDASNYKEFTDLSKEDINRLKGEDEKKGNADKQDANDFLKLYEEIGAFMEQSGIPAEVKISKELTEILIRFKDSVLFDTGQADIKTEALQILDGITVVLGKYQQYIERIRVDGHADSRPINTYMYPTNWELSAKRAVNVVRYFHEIKEIEPSKLSAAAYGPYNPIDSNDTQEGMAKNRRVEIYIVRSVNPAQTIEIEKE